MIGIIVASFMTKWSVDKQNKLGLLNQRTRIYALVIKTLVNFKNSKNMMRLGDNSENDFLEGLCDISTPLLYKMIGCKVVVEKSCVLNKISNTYIEESANRYISELEESICQIDILFAKLKEKKYVKQFLFDYKEYLQTLLDYKLSSEDNDDIRAVVDYYAFKDLYEKIMQSEKNIRKYCKGDGLEKIVDFININKYRRAK